MATKKVGLQIYSIRDIYFKNPIEAFKLIKDCGYDAVEMFGNITMGGEELKELLNRTGLECCGWHTPWNYICQSDILEAFASYNKVIGNKYIICLCPKLMRESLNESEWLKSAYKICEICAKMKKHNIRIGICARAAEFQPMENTDELPWDTLAKHTCGNVILQIDTGDLYEAGIEPMSILKKYPGRAHTIHLKPYSLTKGKELPIGEDETDWAEIVKCCNEQGKTEYFIVDYDGNDTKTAIKTCIHNLKKFL